ncbi:interleukin-6-like [Genypterus blacodes]|uniref:interleukin-6-like n=1 Tax=Genypterus blacodes TaxID=154954 RepID=UPI003F76ADB0
MPSTLNTYLLSCALLMAALPPRVPGAPLADAPAETPAGETSGEEAERPQTDLLSGSPLWSLAVAVVERHDKEFENEFPAQQVDHLDEYKIQSPPAGCRHNLSKESCLQRLVFGLVKYTVLLRHAEAVYPSSSVPSETKFYISLLSSLIREKLKHPEQVEVLSSIQEQQMLGELENHDTFHKKMTAHSVLQKLKYFLIDGKHALARKERANSRTANYMLL